jgi:predicted transcriptional regulator
MVYREKVASLEKNMADKRTMTLNLTDAEMKALEKLAQRKQLTKTALIRQALRLYQAVDARQAAGESIFFEDQRGKKRSEVLVL